MCKKQQLQGRFWKWFIGLMILSTVGETRCEEISPVTVSGEMVCTFYRPNGTLSTNHTATFQVTLSGAKRVLKVHVGDSWRWTYFWDGQTATCSFDDGGGSGMLALHVFPDPFPVMNYFVQVPWFAFAEAKWINPETPAPWGFVHLHPLAHAYDLHPAPDPNPPHLLLGATFVTSQERAKTASKSPYLWIESLPEKEFLRRKNPVLVARNFIAGEYRVVEHVDFRGLHLPARFELVRYHEPPPLKIPRQVTNRQPAMVFSGRITSLDDASAETISAASVPGPAIPSVQDYRFSDTRRRIDFVIYKLNNSPVPPMSDPELIALFEAKKKASPYFFPDEWRAFIVWCGFIIIFSAPIIMGGIRIAKVRKQQCN